MNFHRLIFVLLCAFSAVPMAHCQTSLNLQPALDDFIASYTERAAAKGFRIESEIGTIDPRISVGQCDNNLNLDFSRDPIEYAQTTIQIECLSDKPWRLFVRAEIRLYGKVVIASAAIPRGSQLSKDMLNLQEQQLNRGGYGYFNKLQQVTGMIAKRSIRAGNIVKPGVLTQPELVERGDQVVIVAANEAIEIRMKGTALAGGSMGEQISIRNNRSERVIRAKIIDRGIVAVTL